MRGTPTFGSRWGLRVSRARHRSSVLEMRSPFCGFDGDLSMLVAVDLWRTEKIASIGVGMSSGHEVRAWH